MNWANRINKIEEEGVFWRISHYDLQQPQEKSAKKSLGLIYDCTASESNDKSNGTGTGEESKQTGQNKEIKDKRQRMKKIVQGMGISGECLSSAKTGNQMSTKTDHNETKQIRKRARAKEIMLTELQRNAAILTNHMERFIQLRR